VLFFFFFFFKIDAWQRILFDNLISLQK